MNEKPSKETLEKWNKDNSYWVWGIFYFNKEDIRIFPPKRNKYLGFTVNFANPKSILAFLGMFVFFSLVIYMIETHRM